jgi:UDP-N-acetylmuramate--alanine ligase
MSQQSLFSVPGAHVHIVGIGGAGMSAIARVLLDSGVRVSGSDRQLNDITRALERDGAKIYAGHAAANVAGATVLLISSAIKDNPEVLAAHNAGIPVLTRRETFPHLLPGKTQIAIAGTHGKTTTTALIVHLLRETGNDPSYIVGGVMLNTNDNAHAGQGSAFVIEADEYGDMFLGLTPKIAVITNIEHDHPDIFPRLDDVVKAFRRFVAQIPDDGILIGCADDERVLQLIHERRAAGKVAISYGLENVDSDWQAVEFTPRKSEVHEPEIMFTILRDEIDEGEVNSPLPGKHNILNILAAIAAVHQFGLTLNVIVPHVKTFKGAGRRFEVMGLARGVTVINDYAHNPTKIRATLQAARQRYPDAQIWAVWQPHTYSRVRVFASDFARVFADADHVLVTDIYAAREQRQEGDPHEADLAGMIAANGLRDARYSGDLEGTALLLKQEAKPGNVVIILSAGDAPRIGEQLLTLSEADSTKRTQGR